MTETLLNFEWQALSQLIYRINCQHTYEDFAITLLEQIKTIIPFEHGLVFQAERTNGKIVLKDSVIYPQEEIYKKYSEKYMQNHYDVKWLQYLNSPWSTVFRYSSITYKWENSTVYNDILAPLGIYYAIYITLVHRDQPIGAIALWRKKDTQDFSDKELYMLEMLKIHIELKFCGLLWYDVHSKKRSSSSILECSNLENFAETYNLTKRELEIVQLIYTEKDSQEICDSLYISDSTLRKHIHNIYKKVGIKSRIQLIRKIKAGN